MDSPLKNKNKNKTPKLMDIVDSNNTDWKFSTCNSSPENMLNQQT